MLAKYGTVPTRHASSADVERNDSDAEEGTTREWLARWLLHVPDRVAKTSWSLRIATLAVFALGLLRRAQPIGLFFGWVGKAMMLAALLWAAWLLRLQRAHLSDSLGR